MEDNIITIDYGRGHMRIIADTFFPCTQTDFKKLLKIIERDYANADGIIEWLQKYLAARMEIDRNDPHIKKSLVDRLGRNIKLLIDYCMTR